MRIQSPSKRSPTQSIRTRLLGVVMVVDGLTWQATNESSVPVPFGDDRSVSRLPTDQLSLISPGSVPNKQQASPKERPLS